MSEQSGGPEEPSDRRAGVPPELEWALTPRASADQTPLEDFKNALRTHWRFVLEGPVTDDSLNLAQSNLREAREAAIAKGVDVELIESEFEKEIGARVEDDNDQP
jgi:hypothetical protein